MFRQGTALSSIGYEGSLSGLMTMSMMWIMCCGRHSHQVSTQLNSYGRCWTDVLDGMSTGIIKTSHDGISSGKNACRTRLQNAPLGNFTSFLSPQMCNYWSIQSSSCPSNRIQTNFSLYHKASHWLLLCLAMFCLTAWSAALRSSNTN